MKPVVFRVTKYQHGHARPLKVLESCKELKRCLSFKASYHDRNSKYIDDEREISQSENFLSNPGRPNFLDPSGSTLFMFPGQGSQYMGMCQDLVKYPKVAELYNAASEVLKQDLLQLCLKGPRQNLDQTVTSQMAVFVTSIASIEKIRFHHSLAVEKCIGSFGFSVGEISALVFSGSLSFENGLILVKKYGDCLQRASQEEAGGMLTILFGPGAKVGLALEAAKEHCTKISGISDPVCDKAMYLCPETVVIAGNEEALSFIVKNGKDFGIKNTKRLPVSGAFHSKLMEYSHNTWKNAVEEIDFKVPLIPVYCGYDTKQYGQPQLISKNLERLYYKPVKWLQLMKLFYGSPPMSPFPRPFICAPSQVLRTTLEQTCPQAAETAVCLGSP